MNISIIPNLGKWESPNAYNGFADMPAVYLVTIQIIYLYYIIIYYPKLHL